MANQMALPVILKRRAERILKKAIQSAYRLQDDNPNMLKCIMSGGGVRYVDLSTGQEVQATQLKINVETTQKELPVDQFAANEGNFTSFVSRSSLPAEAEAPEEVKKKPTRKKTSTKKK